MSESADITIKQGEAKSVRFTITDGTSEVNVSAATLSFSIKADKRHAAALVSKADGDFDKSQAAIGIVTVPLSSSDTDMAPIMYVGEVTVTFGVSRVEKSGDINIKVERAVT